MEKEKTIHWTFEKHTKHYTDNYRLSNMNPTENLASTLVLPKNPALHVASVGGLLLPEGIIRPVVRAYTLTVY
jgi:hypothetical protein